jgi:aspartate/methionine/tyrosine aminotransferase
LGGDKFAERMLTEAMVAATPGSAFGPGGAGKIRISYAASKKWLNQALERIAKMLG